MKIGIITLIGNNYGNRLQNYAVQELLTKYGDVFTVKQEKIIKTSTTFGMKRYYPSHIIEAINSRLLINYHISDRSKSIFKRIHYYFKNKDEIIAANKNRENRFRLFDQRYISYEKELLHLAGDDNEAWVKSYDAWACGSDQIWNPNYPTATRNAFLQFVPKERRIALSPSIGISDESVVPIEIKEWISDVPYLSVRETRAATMIENWSGKRPPVFLDPTMLIPTEKWNLIAESSDVTLPNNYAFGYFLGVREKEYVKYINRKVSGMEYVDLLNGENLNYLSFGPADFVKAIRDAKYVFVDSFHGVVFSILFHKQFVVFERSEKGLSMNSRLETILKKFHLENRVFNPANIAILDEIIDYSKVDTILISERTLFREFLAKAMTEISQLEKITTNSINHMQINRVSNCNGCTACEQICPMNSIVMESNSEGFLYPVVNSEICINCGKCLSVCSNKNNDEGNLPMKVFAQKNTDEKIRKSSSSGGVFFELAKSCIENDGVVYGCALDEKMVARHICVDNLSDLCRLQSSKYVQSDLKNTFSEIKQKLSQGISVLFSGTPCQVAGLKNYLGKEYLNLMTIDVLCHGVPSPKLFADYLHYLSKQYGYGKPVSVNFRNKDRGWKRLYMEVLFDNRKRHYVYSGYDRYESLFLNNMSLRPSCYECKFSKSERYGDITLGDFWGIGKKYPKWDDDRGISVVMINTDKGLEKYSKVESLFNGFEETFDTVRAGQRTLYAPTKKNPNRDLFYKCYSENGFDYAIEKYTIVPNVIIRGYYCVIRSGLDLMRKILNKGY